MTSDEHRDDTEVQRILDAEKNFAEYKLISSEAITNLREQHHYLNNVAI